MWMRKIYQRINANKASSYKPHFISGSEKTPKIYNESGHELMICYLDDPLTEHTPYSLNAAYTPKRIYWDRFNSSLYFRFFAHEHIFESHEDQFEHEDYALLYESEAIIPELYQRALEKRDVILKYKYIFTASQTIMDSFENARFIPGNGLWYGSDFQGGLLDSERYMKKTKNISIVSSNKTFCTGHNIRLKLAKKYIDSILVDAYGSFGGIELPKKSIALDDYRYSIVVENDFKPIYFTEKILDCFAAQTVPIYIGARNIGDFFDINGIVVVNLEDVDKIDKVIEKCSEEDYKRRIPAIIENYQRVLSYLSIEDYICKEYFDKNRKGRDNCTHL